MPKRKSDQSKEDRWIRKLKKYEDKLKKRRTRTLCSSDEESKEGETPPVQDVPEFDELLEVEPITLEGVPEVPVASDVPAAIVVPTESAREEEPALAACCESDLIDPELLRALGNFVPETAEWGGETNDNLAKILEPILKSGLKKEVRDEILKKYLMPKNCPLTKAPILNPEVAAVVTETAKNRNSRILKKQNQLGSVLSVLCKIITGMLTKSLETPDALKLLSDACRLIADAHFSETETRRALITPMLDKSFVEPFKDRKRDSHLFGDRLSEFIKSSRGIRKTGQMIKAVPSSSSNLNWRGPPPRQLQRNAMTPVNRSGGPRAVFTGHSGPATIRRQPAAAASAPAHCDTPGTGGAACAPVVCDSHNAAPIDNKKSTSNASTPFPGCEYIIRQTFTRRQVPESALPVMLSSLSQNTKSQYTSSLKLWWHYCSRNGIDAMDIQVFDFLAFLAECLEKGASYGTLNSHRSAISLISSYNIGQDDRIKRFFKGAFKLKPNFPKYSCTWDPSIVLNYLGGLYPNETLTLDILSKKLVMILALATGQRCQTLSLIRISNIKISNERIIISITDLIKTSGVGKQQPTLNLPYFNQRPSVCPAKTLVDYMNMTSLIRPANEVMLILSAKAPYHAVSSQTISRWIKQIMSSSGVDISIFSAHSTRHASTSAAHRAGVSIDTIRRTAGWSDQSLVFANYYQRPVMESSSNFSTVIFEQ